ncbi:hypothetical protein JB92DRAFT_3113382 [Gautieria morchelliformis]|nr:hypothetical protein JB92DRAFT_3113382 [Gautieria morchelliformis]
MHNLLQGVVKNQWYSVWIKGNTLRSATDKKCCELDLIHDYLGTFKLPSFIGRLISQVGEPAGVSLMADAYKLMATVYGPIIVPMVCVKYADEQVLEHEQALVRWETNDKAWEKQYGAKYHEQVLHESATGTTGRQNVEKSADKVKVPIHPKKPQLRMQPGEVDLFMQLAAAIKIYTSYEITTENINRASFLYQEYLLGFKEMYGKKAALKPNHHWGVHLGLQICNFGPMSRIEQLGLWAD